MKVALIGYMAAGSAAAVRQELGPAYEVISIPAPSAAAVDLGALADVEVFVGGPLTTRIAQAAPKLKLFHAFGAGFDGLGALFVPPSVTLANTYHHELAVAEYVLMALFWLNRQPHVYDARLRNHDWTGTCVLGYPATARAVAGQTIVIVGVGRIGSIVARQTESLGAKVIAVSRDPSRRIKHVQSVVGYGGWEDVLPEADHVVITCPLSTATRGLIGAAQLARMKPAAGVINVGRANVVDEQALFDALQQGQIGGAVLDVWYRYPKSPGEVCPPSRFPFHTLPNVLLTPHVSAWTAQTVVGRVRDIVANIRRLKSGEALSNVVHRDQL